MKRNKIIAFFGSLALAATGLVAVSQIKIPVNEAKADDIPTEFQEKVYLQLNSSIWGSANAYYTIHFWNDSGVDSGWPGVEFGTKSGNEVLSATWDKRATHCEIMRFDAGNHENEWNRWSHFNKNSFDAGKYNYFVNTDWTSCSSRCALEPGDSIYLDCSNDLGGWKWDDANAYFKAYLWGSKSITLEGRNNVHGDKDNSHIYEFTIPTTEDGYWFNAKFDRCNPENHSQAWNESQNFENNENNAFKINGQSSGKYTASQWFFSDSLRETNYAKYFLDTCTCDGEKYSFKDAEWANVKGEYNAMSKAAQLRFDNVEADSTAEGTLAEAAARYDILVSYRGFESFAGRLTNSSIVLNRLNETFSTAPATVCIIVASFIGVTAVGGYVFYRKRKEN